MSTSAVQMVILCEDQQQECFIRHFFTLRGYQRHQFRVEKPRAGRGSGEQFVREQFPKELEFYRKRNQTHPGTCLRLVVCMDADIQTVEDRVKSLMKACTSGGVPLRRNGEQVCFVVPKRNIETWLAYLRGEPVDEQTEYRKYACPSDCQQDVERLDEMCRQQKLRPPPLPSLSYACEEFKRLQL